MSSLTWPGFISVGLLLELVPLAQLPTCRDEKWEQVICNTATSPSWTPRHTAGRMPAPGNWKFCESFSIFRTDVLSRPTCAWGSTWPCTCPRPGPGLGLCSRWECPWRPPCRGRSYHTPGSCPASWSPWWTCRHARWQMFLCSRQWCSPDG